MTILRTLLWFVIAAAAMLGAVWLAERPGAVTGAHRHPVADARGGALQAVVQHLARSPDQVHGGESQDICADQRSHPDGFHRFQQDFPSKGANDIRQERGCNGSHEPNGLNVP